jgi:hypothetical protein
VIDAQKFLRPRRCDDAAGLEKHDSRGEQKGFANVVGDKDDGLGQAARQAKELALQLRAGNRIKGSKWLVHEENRWIGSEGAGDADALALPARERVWMATCELPRIESDEVEEFVDTPRDASWFPFVQSGNQADVLCDCEMGEQATLLNYVADATT